MIYTKSNHYELHLGKMQDVLDEMSPESVDAIVTDPPYELGFMGKSWDSSSVAFMKDTWEHCLRVLKPGGYLLAFGGSRTFHRIACAIEDAGFEIRDTIMWLYGSGFPKSMNIGKGIEAREKFGNAGTRNKRLVEQACEGDSRVVKQPNNGVLGTIVETTRKDYVPSTDIAKEWSGWGTCLKPAYEPVIVARKPFTGSLIDNVLEYGVGGINIDECRVGELGGVKKVNIKPNSGSKNCGFGCDGELSPLDLGRFPANVIHDGSEEATSGMPYTKSIGSDYNFEFTNQDNPTHFCTNIKSGVHFEDEGSASRYFYCAKASKRDRDEGLDLFEEKQLYYEDRRGNSFDIFVKRDEDNKPTNPLRRNIHPTVKPVALMQYLVKLVAPKGSVILDPFNGSGSTGKACMYENLDRDANYYYIGVEMTEEYLPISKARIDYAISDTDKLEYEVTPTENDTIQTKKQSKIYLW